MKEPTTPRKAIADAEELSIQRQQIKTTLRKTQDARRPPKSTGLESMPRKGAASQSIRGADAKRSGLASNDGSSATNQEKTGMGESMEQNLHAEAKKPESEE